MHARIDSSPRMGISTRFRAEVLDSAPAYITRMNSAVDRALWAKMGQTHVRMAPGSAADAPAAVIPTTHRARSAEIT